jgi:hypothetical protein
MAQLDKPFVTLGKHLQSVREQASRSLAEVSGAVEIDEKQLKLIEAGQKRPEEDVMLLLISYFNVADQEALHLWELARYDTKLSDHLELSESTDGDKTAISELMTKPMVMLLTMDVRTMYSDGVEITCNEAGVTLNFTQITNQVKGNRPNNLSIAKVGMSYNQAEKVFKTLELALLHAKYNGPTKKLPPGKA